LKATGTKDNRKIEAVKLFYTKIKYVLVCNRKDVGRKEELRSAKKISEKEEKTLYEKIEDMESEEKKEMLGYCKGERSGWMRKHERCFSVPSSTDLSKLSEKGLCLCECVCTSR
jgi:hypothetical protein